MVQPDLLQNPRVRAMQQNLSRVYEITSHKASEAGKWAKEHHPTVQGVRKNLLTVYGTTSRKAKDAKAWVREHNPTKEEKAQKYALCALDSIQEKPSDECNPYRLKRRFGKKHRLALQRVARGVNMLTYIKDNRPDMWQDTEFHATHGKQIFDAIKSERSAFDGRAAKFEKFAGATIVAVAAGIASWYGAYFKAHHGQEYIGYGSSLVDKVGNTVIEHNNVIFNPATTVAVVGGLLGLAAYFFYSARKEAHPNHFVQLTMAEMIKTINKPQEKVVNQPVLAAA